MKALLATAVLICTFSANASCTLQILNLAHGQTFLAQIESGEKKIVYKTTVDRIFVSYDTLQDQGPYAQLKFYISHTTYPSYKFTLNVREGQPEQHQVGSRFVIQADCF